MLLECSCGKMYRVRDDHPNPPRKCPTCGKELKVKEAPAAAAGADPRVKELESKVASLEKGLSGMRAALEMKEKELQAARAAGGGGEDSAKLAEKEHELREAQASIARLGEDLAKEKTAYHDALTKKDEELAEIRSKGQSLIVSSLKEKEREIEEAQASIAKLGEDLAKEKAAYHDALAKKDEEIAELHARAGGPAPTWGGAPRSEPAESGAELERAQARITTLETILQDAERRTAELQEKVDALSTPENKDSMQALERAQSRIATLEKIVQDSERRYSMLKGELDDSIGREGNAEGLSEKDKVIAALEAEVASRKEESLEFQKRIAHLEQIRKADQGSFDARLGAQDTMGARVGEARYLAGDLQRNLESIEAALSGLVMRVKRLHDTLHEVEEEKKPAAAAPPPPPPPPPPPAAPPPPRPPTAVLTPNKPPSAPPMRNRPASTVIQSRRPPSIVPGDEDSPVQIEPEPSAAEGEDLAFPEPALNNDLPADETLLDMGKIGKSVRDYKEPEPAPQSEDSGSPDVVRLVDSSPSDEEAPAPPADSELPEGPLSAETSPGPIPEEEGSDQPKKKGFFGKLFGKK